MSSRKFSNCAMVLEFLEDSLPTYMRTVAGEFAEVFTEKKVKKEWKIIPS